MKRLHAGLVAATVVVVSGCALGDLPFAGKVEPEKQAQTAPATELAQESTPTKTAGSSDIVAGSSIKGGKSQSKEQKSSQSGGHPLGKYFGGPKVEPQGFYVKHEYSDGGYFFQTPSQVHRCEISKKYVGCTSTNPPADAPVVNYPGYEYREANGVRIESGSKAEMIGLTDTSYIRQDGNGPAKTLEYGQVLDVHGFQCTTNKQDGVICKQGSHGFQFSSKKHKVL